MWSSRSARAVAGRSLGRPASSSALSELTIASAIVALIAATAPSPHTHDDRYYTEAEVDALIAGLVDSAPGVLDTLNELAAALGDDENFAASMATALAGLTLVTINPSFVASEVHYVLDQSRAEAIYYSPSVRGNPLGPVVAAACDGLERIAHRILLTDHDALYDGAERGALRQTVPEDVVQIQYTSGTTGFPKGAMHSQSNFVVSGEANIARLWLQPEERMLIVLPMFHVNALFYSLAGGLAAGCTLIIAERFSASTFWDMAVETGATQVNFIDAIGRILKARPRSEPYSAAAGAAASATCSGASKRRSGVASITASRASANPGVASGDKLSLFSRSETGRKGSGASSGSAGPRCQRSRSDAPSTKLRGPPGVVGSAGRSK